MESPKPYLHPIRTRAGHLVSLFRPWDHVWHKGIALSLPHVGEENFWGGPTYVHGRFYVQKDNNGAQQHREFTRLEAVGGTAADATSLVLMVDDADDPQHPPQWFARSEEFACLNPAPFFSGELTVSEGDTIKFRYGVGIADADEDAAPDLAAAVRKAL